MREWDDDFDIALREVIPPEFHEAIGPDVEFLGIGLDSMASVQLLMLLEDAYGIVFPLDLLIPEVFATPGSLWSAVAKLRPLNLQS